MAKVHARLPITYYPLEAMESLDRYFPGGYHPVNLGDTFNRGRYRVLSKLGYGGNSTVWLARDESQPRFVALKVLMAASNQTAEREIRARLARASQLHAGSRYVQRLLDAFVEHGPNGSHQCIVSEPGGFSLSIVRGALSDGLRLFHLPVARAIAAQMVLAVSFVHSQGVVHGDLHTGNFLLHLPRHVHRLSAQEYVERYGSTTEPIQRYDGQPLTASAPRNAVYSRGVGKGSHLMTLAEAGIVLIDFGESWLPSKQQKFAIGTPVSYLPPEALFSIRDQLPLGFAADIWTLAHTIFELFARYSLYSGPCGTVDAMFASAVRLLGRPPEPWWDVWTARKVFFNDAGEWIKRTRFRSTQPPRLRLPLRVEDMCLERKDFDAIAGHKLCAREVADLQSMLEDMLRWEPNARATSQKLEQGSWMRNWGLSALKMHEAQKDDM